MNDEEALFRTYISLNTQYTLFLWEKNTTIYLSFN